MARLRNPRHEAFARAYILGEPARPSKDLEAFLTPEELAALPPETRGNAAASYRAAGYTAKENGAAVNGSRLLSRRDIQIRCEELRHELAQVYETERRRWAEFVPMAQRVIERALAGPDLALAFRAAKWVVERVEGPLSHVFGDDRTGEEKAGYPVLVVGGWDPDEGLPEP